MINLEERCLMISFKHWAVVMHKCQRIVGNEEYVKWLECPQQKSLDLVEQAMRRLCDVTN